MKLPLNLEILIIPLKSMDLFHLSSSLFFVLQISFAVITLSWTKSFGQLWFCLHLHSCLPWCPPCDGGVFTVLWLGGFHQEASGLQCNSFSKVHTWCQPRELEINGEEEKTDHRLLWDLKLSIIGKIREAKLRNLKKKKEQNYVTFASIHP